MRLSKKETGFLDKGGETIAVYDTDERKYREYGVDSEKSEKAEFFRIYTGSVGKIALGERKAFFLGKRGKATPCAFSVLLRGFVLPRSEMVFVPVGNDAMVSIPCDETCTRALESFEKRLASFSEAPKKFILRVDASKREIFLSESGGIERLRTGALDFMENYRGFLPFLFETANGYHVVAYSAKDEGFEYAVVFLGSRSPSVKILDTFSEERNPLPHVAILGGKTVVFGNDGETRVSYGEEIWRLPRKADPKRAIYGAVVTENRVFVPIGNGIYERERIFDEGILIVSSDVRERATANFEPLPEPSIGGGRLVMDAEGFPIFVSSRGDAAIYRNPTDGSPRKIVFEEKVTLPPATNGTVPGCFFVEREEEIYVAKVSLGDEDVSFASKGMSLLERKPSSFFLTGHEKGLTNGYFHYEGREKTEAFFYLADMEKIFVGSRFVKVPAYSVSSGEKIGSGVFDTVSGSLFFGGRESAWSTEGSPFSGPPVANYLFVAEEEGVLLHVIHPKKGNSFLRVVFPDREKEGACVETVDMGDFGEFKPSHRVFNRYFSNVAVRSDETSKVEKALKVRVAKKGEYALIVFGRKKVVHTKEASGFYFVSEKDGAYPFYPHKARMKRVSKNEYAIVGEGGDPLFPPFRVYGRKADDPKLAAVLLFTAPPDPRKPTPPSLERDFSPRRA